MLAIAGAVLINAACVLIASGQDSFDVYSLSRILIAVGAGLIGLDLVVRFRQFVKRSKREGESAGNPAEPSDATERRSLAS